MQQEVEDLRSDGHDLSAPGEFPALLVEHVVSKHESHFGIPWPAALAIRATGE